MDQADCTSALGLSLGSRMMSHPYPLPYPLTRTTTSSLVVVTRPSFVAIVCDIYTRGGLAGFFRGLGPCLLRAFPTNACAFFVYEGMMRVLGAEKVLISSPFFAFELQLSILLTNSNNQQPSITSI